MSVDVSTEAAPVCRAGVCERFARWAAIWTGSSWAFALSVIVILVWAATGDYFEYSDTWQLVINTGTTIVTFLMVFLIQRSQNKDALAIQLKLNELVAAVQGASNRLINVEDLSEDEVTALHDYYDKLSELTRRERNLTRSHTIEEAQSRHKWKFGGDRGHATDKHRESLSSEEQELLHAITQLEDAIHHHEKYLKDLKDLLARQNARARDAAPNGSPPRPEQPVG
jgi:low affinity Fe/Cu permease